MDIARVDQLRRHLHENPRYHNQQEFACGTSACAAGWTVALEYNAHIGDIINQVIDTNELRNACYHLDLKWIFSYYSVAANLTGPAEGIAIYARMLLDLPAAEAAAVFYETMGAVNPEKDTVALLNALVHREKSELTDDDITILLRYGLDITSTEEMSNDV
jgi:hypothetical protein